MKFQSQSGPCNHPWMPHFRKHPGASREDWKAALRQRFGGWAGPAANIDESDDAFTVSIYAAGIRKEAVAVTVKNDVLEVTYQPAEKPATEFASQEHTDAPWKRGFQLNGKVIPESISATYTDGVLRISLPKNPETNTPPVSVTIG